MRLDLYSTHLETLAQLQEIAKKHNCHINVSIGENHNLSLDDFTDCIDMLIQQNKITENIADKLTQAFDIDNPIFLHDNVCFELIEHLEDGQWKYNQMVYNVYSMHFELSENLWADIDDELQERIDENCERDYKNYYFYDDGAYTKVYGFKGVETKVNVYREGMAVKNFGDLVCDYLHEPRIIKTY